ncbi:MAG: hypothetical protein D6717_10835 [Gammaproteobacteria bacterium]|nr:MAG: hypothetical protein D6717_10835 [Gammaproteobacteria bacterium]
MIDGIGNSLGTQPPVQRSAGTDSLGVAAGTDSRQRPEAAEDTPIRPPQQASEDSRLDTEELEQLRELKRRDQEVRAHERAHISAGGQYVRGGAHYSYQYGPDGRRYAVGGEVSIDVAPVPNDPQATLQKAQTIRRAALAPANPSGQDRAVAAQAQQMAIQAQAELARQRMESIKAREAGRARIDDDAPAPPRLVPAGNPAAPTAVTLAEPPEASSLNLDEVV